MHKKNILKLCLLISLCQTAFAQQEAMFLTYPTNPLAVNGAYAGSNGLASLEIMVRRQSLRLNNLPASQFLSYQTPLAEGKSFLGFQAYNANFGSGGLTNAGGNTGFNVASGYRYHVDEDINFSIAGQYNLTQIPGAIGQGTQFKSGFGLGFYGRTAQSYFGIAMPNVSKTTFSFGTSGTIQFDRPIIATLGHVLAINDNLDVKAGLLLKKSETQASTKLDFNGQLWIKQLVGLGLWYNNTGSEVNSNKALIITADVQVNKQFRLGLSYDTAGSQRQDNVNSGRPFNSRLGLYQFLLRYDFDNKTGKIDNFRYF